MYYDSFNTLLGEMHLLADDFALCRLFLCRKHPFELSKEWVHSPHILLKYKTQILQFLNGERTTFDFSISPKGTDFQKKVWQALTHIPYGETRTYGQIAEQIGNCHAYRAVGMANNVNPIPLIIPCHRIIGSNGDLVGYRYGLDIKKWLLQIENKSKK